MLTRRCGVLLTWHVSSSAHILCFPFHVPTSMTTLDVGQIFSKSFLNFLLEFLGFFLTLCEPRVNPRCAAQQWYQSSRGKSWPVCNFSESEEKSKRHAHYCGRA